MKRITSVVFSILLICVAVFPAFAVSGFNGRIMDYGSVKVLTPEETAQLELQISEFFGKYGMELYFVIKSDDPGATGKSYAEKIIDENNLGDNADGGLIAVYDLDSNTFACYPYGYCTDIFTNEVNAEILKSLELFFNKSTGEYDYYEMYSSIIKDVEYYYASKRPNADGTYAPNYYYGAPDSGGSYVIDNCDLFTDEQESALLGKVNNLRTKYSNDFVLLTTNSLDGKSVADYADDYYDYNNYANDGLLFMVCMAGGEGNRDYYTSTKGYAMTALTDYARTEIVEEQVLPLLSSGDYYKAFDKYLDMIDIVFAQAQLGEAYDFNMPYKTVGDYIAGEAIAAVVAAVAAFVVFWTMKSKMNTAVPKTQAREYIVPGSLNITGSQDVFTHSTVTKTAIPKQTSSSSSGGGSHSSSSGSSHGGGGGKF